jgi:hypothetical protein
MRVTKGPMLEQFAALIDEDINVVLEWVNNYVNEPGLIDMQEPTEKERLDSIKCYILFRIHNSVTERIKTKSAEKLAA